MIAPDSRMLWMAAGTVVPFCALIYFAPAIGAMGLLSTVALWAWDAYRGTLVARAIEVDVPEHTKWFQGRPSLLPFEIRSTPEQACPVRVYLDLPGEHAQEGETFVAPGRFEAACTPLARGRFSIEEVQLEVRSPWQLWRVRARRGANAEIRVYPDLRDDQISLRLARQPNGSQRQRQMGQGREFEKLRDYLPGDRFDEIHWRASARHGKPVVRVTQIERTQQVYAVLDSSRLSARGGMLDRFVHAALGIALAAQAQGDKFGLVLFSDQVDAFVRAGSGSSHFARCRDAIYSVQPRRVSPDFEELFAFLQLRIRTRSLLLFLTALDDPLLAEMFVKGVPLVARRNLVMVSVPQLTGAKPLFTGSQPEDLGRIYSDLAGHMQWTRLRELAGTLQHAGVRVTAIDPQQATRDVARQYFDAKRRQLL